MKMFAQVAPVQSSIVRPAFPAFDKHARPTPISTFAADAEVYAQGEPVKCGYHIEYGAVRVFRLLADGRRQVIGFYFGGETFGFEADSDHHFFAETLTPTALRAMSIAKQDAVPASLLAIALRGMVKAQEHLLVIGRQNAGERIAAFLLDVCERQGELETFELPMSRQDIADYLGLTIETISRVLTKLRRINVIRLHSSRTVEILKPETLRAMSR